MGELDQVSRLLGNIEGSIKSINKRLDDLQCNEHATRIDAAFVEIGRRKSDVPLMQKKGWLRVPTWAQTLATAAVAVLTALAAWLTSVIKGPPPSP